MRSEPSPAAASAVVAVVGVDGRGREVPLEGLGALEQALAEPGMRVWIDLVEPDAATLARIAVLLRLHPLVVEDIAERNQRAKIERLEDSLHLVLFGVRFEGEVREAEVDFVLGDRYLLTVHDPDWDARHAPQLRAGPANLLAAGPDLLLHAIVDWLVDGYFPVMDRLTDEIDRLQDDVIERTSSWTLQRLFVVKRELIALRRAVSPAREIFNQLTNRELGLIRAEHVIYYRDVYDHLIRVNEEIDSYRELVSGTLDVYLTSVNNNLSNIMKRLTGLTVILAGIAAIAGVFGASEAGAAFSGAAPTGFWIMTAVIVAFGVGIGVFLRRIGWI